MRTRSGLGELILERASRLPMDEAAFLVLHARLAEPLKGYLRRLTGDAALAEDLLQDAFIRFLASGRIPEDDDHRRNYLYRIATNLARDHFRRARLETTEALHAAAEVRAEEGRRSDAGGDHRADVHAILASLAPRDRELLLLAYVEGLTHREIAGVTGLMSASVKPLLFRARRRFATRLRGAGVESSPSTVWPAGGRR